MKPALQERIDQPVIVVAPSADGKEKEHRRMIPDSRIEWFEHEVFQKIASRYADSTEAHFIFLHIGEAWERFKGNGGRR